MEEESNSTKKTGEIKEVEDCDLLFVVSEKSRELITAMI
jgi:hypothetical protein